MSWDQEVFDPIPATGGKPLVTLRDAARFILKCPRRERALPVWETAVECLTMVGDPEARELSTACRNIGRAIDLAVV
jgi:hypothetical protein